MHHEVDTIIFGTGFHVTDPPIADRVRGRGGASLAATWRGSMRAHLGIGAHGFPNFALLLGPNTGLGHNSVLLMIEAQLEYLRRLLAHRAGHGLATFEPTAAAQRRFVDEVDRGTRGSVWTAGGCVSWYLDGTGRNSALWPGSVRAYRRRLAAFEVNDWSFEPPRPAPEPAAEPAAVAVREGLTAIARTRVQVDGRTAFVSGAASGIGRAVAVRLAAHGCPVAIADPTRTASSRPPS